MARITLRARSDHEASDQESGQGLAEYSLIIALVALVCVAALRMLGSAIAASDGFKLFQLF